MTDLYARPLIDDVRDLANTFGNQFRLAVEHDDPDALAIALRRIIRIAQAGVVKITRQRVSLN